MAGHFDIYAPLLFRRHDADRPDKCAQLGYRFQAGCRVFRQIGQGLDPFAIVVRDAGMQRDDRHRLQIVPLLFQRCALRPCDRKRSSDFLELPCPIGYGVDQSFDLARDIAQLAFDLSRLTRHVAGPATAGMVPFLHIGGHRIWMEQIVAQSADDPFFEQVVRDGAIVRTAATVAMAPAAPPVATDDGETTAADPARRDAR